jgi:hypothetical protein
MGGFGNIARTIGGMGNEIMDARTGLQDLNQKLTENKVKNLLDALGIKQAQQQLEQSSLPQYKGTAAMPGGGVGAITVDPKTGLPSLKTLQGGVSAESVKQSLQQMMAQTPEQDRGMFAQFSRALEMGVDPLKVLEQAQSFFGSVSKTQQKGWQVKLDSGIPSEVIDPSGNSYSALDAQLPAEGRQIVTAYQTAIKQQHQWRLEEMQAGAGIRSQDELQRDALKSSDDARLAYTALQEAHKAARANDPRSQIALVIDAVRGTVQGAGRMTQAEILQQLNAGSYGDRLKRWYSMATTGTLPPDQVNELIDVVQEGYDSKRNTAVGAWQYAYGDKPLPPWLKDGSAAGNGSGVANTPTPPKGYVLDKK